MGEGRGARSLASTGSSGSPFLSVGCSPGFSPASFPAAPVVLSLLRCEAAPPRPRVESSRRYRIGAQGGADDPPPTSPTDWPDG